MDAYIFINEIHMASIKRNFGYNLILTAANYIFPLIIYPYISRVLGVNNIGACNFVDSIINYFVLFSTLGVGSLGVREIARCTDNRLQRNIVFSNLLLFNMVMTFLSIIVLIICTYTISSLAPYKEFLLIGVFKLLFTPLTIEWFFQGIQVFKFITVRTIFVRILYVISLFVFVHKESDVYVYYTLTILIVLINGIWNYTYSKHFVSFTFKNFKPMLYFSPLLVFGYYRILTSLYTTFNTFYLGFTSGDMEVGFFTTATKITTLVMSVFTAFTTIMVPKIAEMLQEGKRTELQQIANKTFSLLTTLSLPIILLCLFCADDIILIIAGNGFEGAIPVFRIVIGLILIIGIEQIVVQQFLMASKNNKTIFTVSTVGAIIGLSTNFCITPSLGSMGSATAWTLSEVGVMITGLILLNKTMKITLPIKMLLDEALWSLLYLFPLFLVYLYVDNIWYSIILSFISVIFVFVGTNFFFRTKTAVSETFKSFKK